MNLKALQSLNHKATDNDLKTINALFSNVDQDLLQIKDKLPCELSEDQIKVRYFRQPKEMRTRYTTTGTSFNYFITLGGKIKLNPHKEAELRWILGS